MTERTASINVLFFGTPDFAAIGLQSLIDHPNISVVAAVTQPDRPAGRGKKLTSSPVKALAESHSIPVLQPEKLKREQDQFLKEIATLGSIDVGVVIAFGQILPRSILEAPRCGCINVHASLLPRWRGAAPIQRAILAGDSKTGVCLMQMEEGLDTGPVHVEQELEIGSHENCGSLHDRLASCGAELLSEYLIDIVQSSDVPTPQPEEGVTYAHKISREDALIDWQLSCEQISRVVRAFSPVPGAYTFLGKRRLKVLEATPQGVGSDVSNHSREPGEIIPGNQQTLAIQCGSGYLSVHELQLEGKKKMSAVDFLRGNEISIGTTCRSTPIGECVTNT